MDLATDTGLPVLTLDRACYGGSDHFGDDINSFARHAQLLSTAVSHLLSETSAPTVVLLGTRPAA